MSEQETTSSRHSKEMVVKSNELIQAGYTLSLIEQRMILLSIVQARETGTGISAADHLTISAAAYAKQFDVSREAAYMALKEAAGSLFDRQVTLHDPDPASGQSRQWCPTSPSWSAILPPMSWSRCRRCAAPMRCGCMSC